MGRTELTQADCEAIAAMFQAKRKPNDPLAWLERGIKMDNPHDFQSGAGRLAEMQEAVKVDRDNISAQIRLREQFGRKVLHVDIIEEQW